MAKATNKTQAGTQAQADSKRKGKATAEAEASQPTADSKAGKADKPTADKPAGRAEAEAAALAMVGEVKTHTGGRINLDSVRICPRKAGKVKAFLRPTYETPDGVTLTPYEAGGFTGYAICDLMTEAGRQTLVALIAAKRKPASKGKADKPAGADKGKATGQQATQQASQQAGKGRGKASQQADKATDKASKPTGQQGKGKAGKGKAEATA